MYYFDTSFLAPLIMEEASSAKVEAYLRKLPVGKLWVSQLVRVEFSSLLAREVRMGNISPNNALAADDEFEAMITESYRVIAPGVADYELAKSFIRQYSTGLRAGDALHLAIAKNHGADLLLTLDKGLLKAGKLMDIPVSHGIKI
ncbi:MAG: type II toxin-antitoxin system VapC family toxin [Sulfuricella sp.]|nr:type II toxin-antitoxin system VapC family toxin [Sulfuricella sp.]